MNLGYACINTALSANKIMTNRTMRRKTFDARGIDYVSELSLANVKDLKTIEDAISKKLTRIEGMPPKGSLVLTDQCRRWVIGKAMGIAWGADALFLNDNGIDVLPIESITSSWGLDEV